MSINELKFGLTYPFDCSYLPDREERLLVAVDDSAGDKHIYSQLVNLGFRRSGAQVYRPHCQTCIACSSIRIPITDFQLSTSQKRNLNKNKLLSVKTSDVVQDNYYELYQRYVDTVHYKGAMYPANSEQFSSFLSHNCFEQLFIETWLDNKLLAVAICDVLTDGLSALYTFYDPNCRALGLGTFSILKQIDYCRNNELSYLYLGYQIDECSKMNYKAKFKPHELFLNNQWKLVNK